MRKIIRPLALLLLLSTFSVMLLGACTPTGPAVTTEKPVATEGTAQTTQPQETEPPVDTSAFNYGKVNYVKDEKKTTIAAFNLDNLGKAVKSGEDGVITLFDEDFSDGDPNCGGKAISRDNAGTGVEDGVMYIPYSADTANHISGGWTTWAPDVDSSVKKYYQTQLSTDVTVISSSGNAWTTGYIGCYVNNYTYKIPDNPGDGLWISFNSAASKITVYGGNSSNWNWPAGNVDINVAKDMLDGQTHIDVVTTKDYDTLIYIKSTLVCKITCNEGVMKVYDATGEEKYSGDIDMASISGTHYSIFCHGGGGLGIDNMQVFACTEGGTTTETTVTATPIGDNKLGLDITNRNDVVSICYSMWFNVILGEGEGKVESAPNVAELTELYGFSKKYGFGTRTDSHNAVTAFHYWSKPAQGYYRSTDKDAIRNNMTLLYNAGVDFIILDYTYASAPGYNPGTSTWSSYIYRPSVALLDTIMEMRAEGLGTPYVVFWLSNDSMFDAMQENFYGIEKWSDCFVYWNNKPFIMEWSGNKTENDYYTIRSMYGLRGGASSGQWSYLEIDNTKTVSYISEGVPEHVCACVATQETYMSLPTAHGRDGGKFWNSQWQTAFEVHPKIVTVTWWNEWCAQLYKVDTVGYVFTDNFNQEYSRDVEPMEGGHGDLYYRWLCTYIADYRAGKPCPDLTEK